MSTPAPAPDEIPLPPEPPDPEDMEGDPDVCEHPFGHVYFEPGNYIHPYGWEQHPAWVCDLCGESVEPDPDDENEDYEQIIRDREDALYEGWSA